MIWNVYRYNINKNEIQVFNVFQHSNFNNDVKTLLAKSAIYADFVEELKRITSYYFRFKAEYEIVCTSFPPYVTDVEITRLNKNSDYIRHAVNIEPILKVDIYQQLMLNWKQFCQYVWNNKSNCSFKR